MTDRQRHGFVLLLVVGLIAASAVILTQFKTILGLDLKGGVELVYQAQPTAQTPHVNQAALNRVVDIMNARVNQLGVAEPEIQTNGGNQISVGLPDVTDTSRAIQEVGTTARLEFYDWENSVLLPDGKTVASVLTNLPPGFQKNPNLLTSDQKLALQISQGGGSSGQGSMSLYDAVKLASKQPVRASKNNSRKGAQYYLFGKPSSAACKAAERSQGVAAATVPTGFHCLLNGPDSSVKDLYSGLPTGVSIPEAHSQSQVLSVPQGTAVLLATQSNFSLRSTPISQPSAQCYVLKDNVALFGSDISNPQQSTDSAGQPDVTFGFNGSGQTKFQQVTAQIAARGKQISGLNTQQSVFQHCAVALGGLEPTLVTVPYIDFNQNPQGIIGGGGADIQGGFTQSSASALAQVLRVGALPVNLLAARARGHGQSAAPATTALTTQSLAHPINMDEHGGLQSSLEVWSGTAATGGA